VLDLSFGAYFYGIVEIIPLWLTTFFETHSGLIFNDGDSGMCFNEPRDRFPLTSLALEKARSASEPDCKSSATEDKRTQGLLLLEGRPATTQHCSASTRKNRQCGPIHINDIGKIPLLTSNPSRKEPFQQLLCTI
jgi:hypothetical protein